MQRIIVRGTGLGLVLLAGATLTRAGALTTICAEGAKLSCPMNLGRTDTWLNGDTSFSTSPATLNPSASIFSAHYSALLTNVEKPVDGLNEKGVVVNLD